MPLFRDHLISVKTGELRAPQSEGFEAVRRHFAQPTDSMPGKIPSLLKKVEVEQAQRVHACHRDGKHLIRKGEWRVHLGVGQDAKDYCITCAEAALTQAEQGLQTLRRSLENTHS